MPFVGFGYRPVFSPCHDAAMRLTRRENRESYQIVRGAQEFVQPRSDKLLAGQYFHFGVNSVPGSAASYRTPHRSLTTIEKDIP